jgi:prefoldin subunit 5
MAKAKLDQQIETLQEKLKQLKTRQLAIENRKKAISSKRERKQDTRRKILVGAIVMAKVEQKVLDEKLLRGWLNEALTRPDDRALFELPPVARSK